MTEPKQTVPDPPKRPEHGVRAEGRTLTNKVPRLTAAMQRLQEAEWQDTAADGDD